jgi:hypothetical protein
VAVVAVIVVGSGGGDDEDVIDTRTQTTAQTTPTITMSTTTEPANPPATQAEPADATPVVEIRDGKPVGGVQRLRFRKGGDIVFEVRSDADHEIHLHGYDIAKDVEAGGSVRYDVPARIDGGFEVEIEDTGAQLLDIEVIP